MDCTDVYSCDSIATEFVSSEEEEDLTRASAFLQLSPEPPVSVYVSNSPKEVGSCVLVPDEQEQVPQPPVVFAPTVELLTQPVSLRELFSMGAQQEKLHRRTVSADSCLESTPSKIPLPTNFTRVPFVCFSLQKTPKLFRYVNFCLDSVYYWKQFSDSIFLRRYRFSGNFSPKNISTKFSHKRFRGSGTNNTLDNKNKNACYQQIFTTC